VRRVGGLDGCRGGWVLATVGIDERGSAVADTADVQVISTFAEAVALVTSGQMAALGVDMPIGLPDAGRREADFEARRRLGPRASSVFPTPLRSVLSATDYPDALLRSRAVDGKGLSKQAFNLLPKMVEVDAAMTPALQDQVFECHPETAFVHLAGRPLTTTKREAVGWAERVDLLATVLGDVTGLADRPPPGAKVDDVLDALAVATVATRLVGGRVERLGDGALDARGLRMEIVT